MTPPVLLFLVAALAGGSDPVDSPERRDLRLVVETVQNGSDAPGSFLDDLLPILISDLARQGCFGHVQAADAAEPRPHDLALRISFDWFEDEVTFDESIAQRSDPGRPPEVERREQVLVRVGFLAELRLPGAEGAVVRSKHYRRQAFYRPVHDEDPRPAARAQLVTTVARTVRGFSCDGSEKRFREERTRAAAR